MQSVEFKVRGMDCAEEVQALKAEIAPLAGVQDMMFDVLNGKMTVVFAESQVSLEALIKAVARTGMQAEVWQGATPTDSDGGRWSRWGRSIMTAASGACLLAGLAMHAMASGWRSALLADDPTSMPTATKLLDLGAVVAGAWYVVPKAWLALRRLRPDMNLLMMVAMLGAIFIREYFEAGTVAFLFALSLAIESWSVGRARRAIAALMSLSPETGRIIRSDGREVMMPVGEIMVGSHLVVLPGEKFPLDGTVAQGETTVDQAPITGESMPVAKSPGSEVFAGTINHDGAVQMVTTRPAADTTLARVIRMVGDAHSKRSPSEQWVETFARYYTPLVMSMALVVIVLPPLLFGAAWSTWFYQGLVLLVVACPCALVISTPVSIVAALTSAARSGVLIKGGTFVEAPARLKVVAVDKTGTLTQGKPEVHTVVPWSGHTEAEVLAIAAAIEKRSEHPLAKAIVRAAENRKIEVAPAENFQATRGKGATATVDGQRVWLGSHRLLEERGQETAEMHERLAAMERDGSSVVVIGKDEHVCGMIALADQIRPEAASAVQSLRAAGVHRVIMLTGDNRGTGEAIGRQAGIDEVRAELLPDDKVSAIEELVKQYGQVAMIGDGVNDAPAMARASIGIAMGVAGTDAALETADIALMGDDLGAVAWLIRHSRRTLTIIRQNIVASLGVKAVFVILTLTGHASLWAAIAADTGASLLVTFNALRLLGAYGRIDRSSALGNART